MKAQLEKLEGKGFRLGQVVATPGALELGAEVVLDCLKRHAAGDWGDLSPYDARLNDLAVRSGDDRILSSYKTPAGELWVITERDRSSTCVLLPSEY